MTPEQIKDSIRNQVYETSAAYWSDAEIYTYMWQGEAEIAGLIQANRVSTATTSVTSTSTYTKPTDCLIMKRLTWDDVKLKKIDQTDIDAMDGNGYGGAITTGDPHSYYEWGNYVRLYPIPDSAETLKYQYIGQPTLKSDGSTGFDNPQLFDHYYADYCLYRMYLKEQDEGRAAIHKRLWDENVVKGTFKWKKSIGADMHSVVRQEDVYPSTELGLI